MRVPARKTSGLRREKRLWIVRPINTNSGTYTTEKHKFAATQETNSIRATITKPKFSLSPTPEETIAPGK